MKDTRASDESMISGFTIRSVRADDAAAVTALLGDAALPVEGVADQFAAGFVVAVNDKAVIGAAGIETYGAAGLLRSVVVHDTVRGRGIGEVLVRERLDWARSRGLQHIYLLTTTAAPFFTRLGFDTIQRADVPAALLDSPEFADLCPATATVMVKRIA